jgi:mono/diheme cytochrome c family protein
MRRGAVIAVLVLAVFALGVAACGGEEDVTATPETVEGTLPETETGTGGGDLPALDLTGDATAGKAVWDANGCSGCHTLAAAGASGTVGPNLDDAKPSFELAVERVTNGQGAMPTFGDKLTPQQIADVAQYVSESAGS